jgi:hypothetical protein
MVVLSGSRIALDTRIAAVAMAIIFGMVTVPMVSGWVVADTHCTITMDICHPAQSIDVSHASLFAPAPQLFTITEASRAIVVALDDAYRAMAGRLGEAPDLPPPKTLI